jgi:hypothetical protein
MRLTQEREQALGELGFRWDAPQWNFRDKELGAYRAAKRRYNAAMEARNKTDRKRKWYLKFAELRSFYAVHGHFSVPTTDKVRRLSPCFPVS